MVQKTINLSDYYASKDDVTDSKSGLMNSTQKKKLDEIEPKATRTIIEDNLDSESTTKALSAAQGNLLNQKFNNYVTKDGNKQLSTYDFNQTYKDIVDSIPETIAQSIGNISIFKVLGKDEPFPTDEDAVNHIYFKPNTIDESPNRYDVYVNVKGNWEKIDGFDYNITDYLTKTDASNIYATKQNVSDNYAIKDHRHTGTDIDNFPLANTSSDMIKMNGTKSAGGQSTTTYAKADHVHPPDDSKSDVGHDHDDRYLQTVPQHVDSEGKYGKATADEWGHTKLCNDIDSNNELISATPKAVRSVYEIVKTKADISALNKKIDKEAIQDNLTIGGSTNVLSAAQGKELKRLIDLKPNLGEGPLDAATATHGHGNGWVDVRFDNNSLHPTYKAATFACQVNENLGLGKLKFYGYLNSNFSTGTSNPTYNIDPQYVPDGLYTSLMHLSHTNLILCVDGNGIISVVNTSTKSDGANAYINGSILYVLKNR